MRCCDAPRSLHAGVCVDRGGLHSCHDLLRRFRSADLEKIMKSYYVDSQQNVLPPLSAYIVMEYVAFGHMSEGTAFEHDGHAWVKLGDGWAQMCVYPFNDITCDNNELFPILTA